MMKELSKMHEEDAHDDNRDLIAMETSNQIHTRAQIRAAKNAANSHILETNDVGNDTNSPLHVRKRATPPVPDTMPDTMPDTNQARDLDNVTLLPFIILPPRTTSGDDLAAVRRAPFLSTR